MIQLHPFEESATAVNYQYPHSRFIGALVMWRRPEVVVEVGTHIGATAVWIARALQLIGAGRLYCIDPWCWVNETQEEQWEANLAACGVRDFVTHLRGRSQEVEWPARVDMAYIDGNHTYDVCRADAEKARDLGASVIVFHDTVSWEGSRRYTEEIRTTWPGWDFMEEVSEGGLLVAKKQENKPACEGFDIGEQWDVSAAEVEKRRPGRPRKVTP